MKFSRRGRAGRRPARRSSFGRRRSRFRGKSGRNKGILVARGGIRL